MSKKIMTALTIIAIAGKGSSYNMYSRLPQNSVKNKKKIYIKNKAL